MSKQLAFFLVFLFTVFFVFVVALPVRTLKEAIIAFCTAFLIMIGAFCLVAGESDE